MSGREERTHGRGLGRGTGAGTRLFFSGQLGLDLLLALAVVLGLNWLSGRPGVRQRFDMTEKGTNTISEATRGILAKLEDEVRIDVFWRGEEVPLEQVGPAAMDRVFHLLQLIQADSGGRVKVKSFDRASSEEIRTRLTELKISGYENCAVVSRGERREILRLRGDLAQFEYGDRRPQSYRPAAIRAFIAEDSIAQALLRVTRGETAKILVTYGQGEASLDDHDAWGISMLEDLLAEEAMEISVWSWEREPKVPADCDALLIAAPDTPFPPAQLEAIRSWTEAGGRLIVAAHDEDEKLERSDVPELFHHFGFEVRRGLVMNPSVDALGRPSLEPELIVVVPVVPSGMQPHPITNPLRDANRRIFFSRVHPVLVKSQPELPKVGTSMALLDSSSRDGWLDVLPVNYQPETARDEFGKFPLCVVSRFAPDFESLAQTKDPQAQDPETVEARIVALGGVSVLANQRLEFNADFVRNLFRWVTSRDYRLGISPRDPDQRRLAGGSPEAQGRVTRVALWWTPAVCLLLGLVTAILRSRGGPRQTAAGPRPEASL